VRPLALRDDHDGMTREREIILHCLLLREREREMNELQFIIKNRKISKGVLLILATNF